VPQIDTQWGDFEVRSQGLPHIQTNADGTETTAVEIDVTLFNLGAFTTPALQIRAVDPNGATSTVDVAPATLTVNSVLTGDDTTLRDIKPQWTMDVPVISPLVYGAVALLVIAVIAGLSFLIRKTFASRPVVDNRTPYQKAHDELTRIEGLGLPAQGMYQEHYQLVSNAVRALFEQVYSFPCTDLTTVETKRWFTHMDLPIDLNRYAIDLLKDCDAVKFSNLPPNPEAARVLTARAQQLIFAIEPVPDKQRTGTARRVA
jgi:hypothetical protein